MSKKSQSLKTNARFLPFTSCAFLSARWLKILLSLSLVLSLFGIFSFPLHQDIFFHTDIARDFLLVQEMVQTLHPTLIGARTGGIPGLFHGPLWLYTLLPAFVVTGGSPVGIGFWWSFLNLVVVASCFWIGRRLFSPRVGLYAAALSAALLVTSSANLTNPFGAYVTAPWILYFWYQYLKTLRWPYAAAMFLTLGLTIQFQIAFGGPLLVVALLGTAWLIIKNKRWLHLLSPLAILPALSTYLVFDLRNNFLQTRAVLSYLSSPGESGVAPLSLSSRFADRLQLAVIDSFSFVPTLFNQPLTRTLGPLVVLTILLLVIHHFWSLHTRDEHAAAVAVAAATTPTAATATKKQSATKPTVAPVYRDWFLSLAFFYLGYWLLASLYPGTMWIYYYSAFLPIIVLGIASASLVLPQKIFLPLFALLLIPNLYDGLHWSLNVASFSNQTDLSWQSYRTIANDIYRSLDDSTEAFGYYIYTPDLYGYQPRYAMEYLQDGYPDLTAKAFQKADYVFLITAAAPKDKPYLNGDSWKKNDVGISSEPISRTEYASGYVVEKYQLTEEEQQIPSNPNLIQDLHFR